MESDSDGDQSIVNKEGSEEVMVSDLDDEDDMIPRSTGLRRTKEGSRVEGIQIDFTGKGYGAKHEVSFMINGVKDERETKKRSIIKLLDFLWEGNDRGMMRPFVVICIISNFVIRFWWL